MAEILPTLDSAQFDCIIADPPYGLNACEEFGDAAKLRHDYEDSPLAAMKAVECIAKECNRLAKERAHLYLFCDIDQFVLLKQIVAEHGWRVWRTPIIWNKGSTGYAPAGTQGFRRSYELILFASKGGKNFGALYSDIVPVPNVREKNHAAEKPTAIYAELLKRSCLPCDRVLDPCCGSGTIFAAAKEQGVIAMGIELNEETYGLALARLHNESTPGTEAAPAAKPEAEQTSMPGSVAARCRPTVALKGPLLHM